MEKKSNCCGALLHIDTDICSKCGEHCTTSTNWYEKIQEERERQVEEKGYTHEHDDNEHSIDDLSILAASYLAGSIRSAVEKHKIEKLTKAASLIVAELDRLERHDLIS